ncbi:chorismate mutase [Pseudomonas sp. H9]|uniref:chorismate mutase n=1 Tax=Pseudomonas sp. H9 TaxID=483968 RepID=UPI0010578069|nr:chorismate mutase [Pseudomonas sp. H9]TDF85013.1 chorismate mutase [Pseudomonas sp. H9]
MHKYIPALLLTPLLLSQGCATPPPPDNNLQRLLNSVEQRLDIAQAVALNKWDSGQPVQDAGREIQVITNVQAQATRFGVDAERAATFFTDQIEANKLLQYSALSKWHAVGSAPQTHRVDLAKHLRPQLDRLQRNLLSELAAFDRNRPEPCQPAVARAIGQRTQNPQQALALIRATAHLCVVR